MGKVNKPKQAPEAAAPSQTEKTLLVITPASTTVEPTMFYLTDTVTGETIGSKHCLGPLFAKSDLSAEFDTELHEKYGDNFEVKFIDQAGITMDDLVALQAGQINEIPKPTIEHDPENTKAQIADDEQPEDSGVKTDEPLGDVDASANTDEI